MKLILKMSVIVTAALMGATTQADTSSVFQSHIQSPTLLLAEGGADRLNDYHLQNALARSQPDQTSERYVQMIKEQPTASGAVPLDEVTPQTKTPNPALTSPIIRDREEYRSAH